MTGNRVSKGVHTGTQGMVTGQRPSFHVERCSYLSINPGGLISSSAASRKSGAEIGRHIQSKLLNRINV